MATKELIRETAIRLGVLRDAIQVAYEKGEPAPEIYPLAREIVQACKKALPSIYTTAWNELYKCFGERLQQDELDLMDSVLKSVELDMEEKEMVLVSNIHNPFAHLPRLKNPLSAGYIDVGEVYTEGCQDQVDEILRRFPHLASKEADEEEL